MVVCDIDNVKAYAYQCISDLLRRIERRIALNAERVSRDGTLLIDICKVRGGYYIADTVVHAVEIVGARICARRCRSCGKVLCVDNNRVVYYIITRRNKGHAVGVALGIGRCCGSLAAGGRTVRADCCYAPRALSDSSAA